MTPAQHDILLDFDYLKSLCLHSWSEREVVAAIERLRIKVQAEQRSRSPHAKKQEAL